MYSYLKERIKHAVRFRHKRGFGVHSPFMFNLILNVIRDRKKRYRYPFGAEAKRKIGYRERKFYRLLFRLAEFLEVKNILCFGVKTDDLSLYLSELPAELRCNQPIFMAEADFIYIGKDARAVLQNVALNLGRVLQSERRCVVITDIYKNSFNARLWQQWRGKATVTVDMMWYGILFFDEKLQKGRYNLTI